MSDDQFVRKKPLARSNHKPHLLLQKGSWYCWSADVRWVGTGSTARQAYEAWRRLWPPDERLKLVCSSSLIG